MYSYSFCLSELADPTNTQTIFSTNKGYENLFAPMLKKGDGFVPNFKYRYLTEDIPNGLCVLRGIADIVKVEVPTINKIILWAQKHLGREYLNNDGTLGKDFERSNAPQATHIMDVIGDAKADVNVIFSHL